MSNSDWNSSRTARGETTGNGGSDDLKGILRRIADQISDVDKRHFEALSDMRSRIGQLGERTETAKGRSPLGYAAAFERIEDRLAALAERLAESQRTRAEARGDGANQPAIAVRPEHPFPHAQPASPIPPALKSAFAAYTPPAATAHATPARHDEPVLKSQVSSAAVHAAQHASAQTPVPAKPAAPAVAAAPHVPTGLEPWDADQAQALTEVYAELSGESAAQAAKKPMTDADRAAEAATKAVERAAELAVEKAYSRSSEAARGERTWLEGRFGDIAKRIERSVVDSQPSEGSLQTLGRRFDDFEARLDGLLRQIAARGDKDALATIDAHVSDIANHLGEIETQLARLDKVEHSLAQVAGKLSDPQAFKGGAEAAPTEAVLMAVAAAAADKAIAQSRQGAGGEDAQRLDQIKHLVEGYMSESREGDGHTASILESMQNTLNRMVERLDGLEAVGSGGARNGHPQGENGANSSRSTRAAAISSDEVTETPAALRHKEAVVAPAPEQAPAPRHSPAELGRAIPERVPADPVIGERPASGREDFIAAARRAARQAANQPAAATPGKPAAAAPKEAPAEVKRGLFAFLRSKPAAVAEAAEKAEPSAPKSGTSKPIMVVAVIALLIASGGMLYGKLVGRNGPLPGNVGQPTAAAPAPASMNSQQPSAGSGMIPAPTEAATQNAAAKAKNGNASEPGPAEIDDEDATNAAAGTPPMPPAQASPARVPSSGPPSQATQPADRQSNMQKESDSEIEDEPAGTQPAMLPPAPRGPAPMPGRPTSQLQPTGPLADPASRVAAAAIPLGIAISEPAAALPTVSYGNPRGAQPQPAQPRQQMAGAMTTASIVPAQPNLAQPAPVAPLVQDTPELPPAMVGPLSMRLAAQKGDPAAEFEVASRYAQGNGIPRDFERAAYWYGRSASHGFAPAQYRLGTLYERGLGVPNDTAQARAWYRRSAEAGNTKSMHNLAVLSAQRDSGAPDYATAANWFTEAAERGLSDSQFNLGILYENGLGVTKSVAQSYKWFSLAAAQGDKEAAKRRDQVHARMQAADRSVAEEMVRNWHPKASIAAANDARAAGAAYKLQQQQTKTAVAKQVPPQPQPQPQQFSLPDLRN